MKFNQKNVATATSILLLLVIIYLAYIEFARSHRSGDSEIIIIRDSDSSPVYVSDRKTGDARTSTVQEQHKTPYLPTYTDDIIDPNVNRMSYWNYTDRKATERIINPLLPPERSYVPTYGVPVNVPTRGIVGGFQQVGMLYKDEIADPSKTPGNNSESKLISLYGRPVDTSRNKWTYYATGDGFQTVKIPVTYKGRKCDSDHGCEEITSDDEVKIPSYNGAFKAEIYDYDKPRYIPSVY